MKNDRQKNDRQKIGVKAVDVVRSRNLQELALVSSESYRTASSSKASEAVMTARDRSCNIGTLENDHGQKHRDSGSTTLRMEPIPNEARAGPMTSHAERSKIPS